MRNACSCGTGNSSDALTGVLYYDADGTGAAAAQQFATLTTRPTLTYAEFLIV